MQHITPPTEMQIPTGFGPLVKSTLAKQLVPVDAFISNESALKSLHIHFNDPRRRLFGLALDSYNLFLEEDVPYECSLYFGVGALGPRSRLIGELLEWAGEDGRVRQYPERQEIAVSLTWHTETVLTTVLIAPMPQPA